MYTLSPLRIALVDAAESYSNLILFSVKVGLIELLTGSSAALYSRTPPDKSEKYGLQNYRRQNRTLFDHFLQNLILENV